MAGANVGKTNAMLNDAIDLALDDAEVAIASLELPHKCIGKRMASIAGKGIQLSNITIYEMPSPPIYDIIDMLAGNCDVLIIDFVSVIDSMFKKYHSINKASTLAILSHFAKVYNTPIITADQMTRSDAADGKLSNDTLDSFKKLNIIPIYKTPDHFVIGDKQWQLDSKLKFYEKYT